MNSYWRLLEYDYSKNALYIYSSQFLFGLICRIYIILKKNRHIGMHFVSASQNNDIYRYFLTGSYYFLWRIDKYYSAVHKRCSSEP